MTPPPLVSLANRDMGDNCPSLYKYFALRIFGWGIGTFDVCRSTLINDVKHWSWAHGTNLYLKRCWSFIVNTRFSKLVYHNQLSQSLKPMSSPTFCWRILVCYFRSLMLWMLHDTSHALRMDILGVLLVLLTSCRL